jgi:hypothetical protein
MTVSILSGEVRGRHEGERNIRDVSEGVRISRTMAGVNARLSLKARIAGVSRPPLLFRVTP